MTRKIIGIAATVAWFAAQAASAQSLAWSHRIFGAPDPDRPGSYYAYGPTIQLVQSRPYMAWTPAGTPGVVTIGEHHDFPLVAKLALTDGAELWRRDVGNPDTLLRAIAVDSGGDLFVSGGRLAPAFNINWYLAKVSGATGQTVWDTEWLPADSPGGSLVALAPTANGDVVALGSRDVETNSFSYLVRVSGASGDVLWTAPIPHPVGLPPALLATDAADNAFVSPGGAVLVKVAANGTRSWVADLSQWSWLPCAHIRDLAIDPVSGDAIAAGSTVCSTSRSGFVARIGSAAGNVVWLALGVGQGTASNVTALAFGPNGGIVAGGDRTLGSDTQWFAATLSRSDGTTAWTAAGAERSRGAVTDIAVAPDGDVFLTGICDDHAHCASQLDGRTGTPRGSLGTGQAYFPGAKNFPNTILAAGGGVFFGGRDTSDDTTTWTVHRIDPALSDAIYADGFE